MGGLGSGRRKDRTRKTVESYWTLDVNQLSETGCLRPGCSSTCQWTDGNGVASINLRAETERLCVSYAVRVGDGGREDVVDTISVVYLRCRFGGSRAYFICPGPGYGMSADGEAPTCTSRTAIFYADIAVTSPTQVNMSSHGSEHSGGPSN